jgi:hypothetical protein
MSLSPPPSPLPAVAYKRQERLARLRHLMMVCWSGNSLLILLLSLSHGLYAAGSLATIASQLI